MKKQKLLLTLAVTLLCTACYTELIDYNTEYHVYYYPGYPNEGRYEDPKTYHYHDIVEVLDKPESFNKPGAVFLGWEYQYSYNHLYQQGQTIVLDWDSQFTAVWGDDPKDFEYTITGDTVTITGYSGGSYLSIPQQIEGKNVTAIGNSAFYQRNISSVISLPSTLETIGLRAFMGNYIDTLELPDSVKTIKAMAFRGCYLRKLTFGKGLEEIGDYAFDSGNLDTLEFPPSLKTIGTGAFLFNEIYGVTIGANVDIVSDDALENHEQSFKAYYDAQGKAAGSYDFLREKWIGPYQE
jgi:hypothetical protein